KRIHILRGFAIIFDALDEAIKLIRASRNKADAAQRLMHRFGIDDIQADAILEIKLYRLAQMEIDAIKKELEEKEAMAAELRALLADEDARWSLIRKELRAAKKQFADERRTTVAGPDATLDYDAEDYIIAEDVVVIVTRDGWVKRQRSYTTLDAIRVREGDEVAYALGGSTRASLVFFTTAGRAYTLRVDDLPQTSGYGDPIQKYFDFSDGERLAGAVLLDPRVLPPPYAPETDPELFQGSSYQGDGAPPNTDDGYGPFVLGVTTDGQTARMALDAFADPSNKNGRGFMRLGKGKSKSYLLSAHLCRGNEHVCLATRQGRALIFPAQQVPVVKSMAKGVIAIRLDGSGDRVLGAALSTTARDGLEVETSRGRSEIVRTTKFDVANRGGKGRVVIQRGTLRAAKPEPVVRPLPE
ncbi:MAG: DNA gyrase subunit A, partial [Bacteroidota bacterium]